MTTLFRIRAVVLILLGSLPVSFIARADCTLTNLGIAPLNERAFSTYLSNQGGLYSNPSPTLRPNSQFRVG